MPCDRKLKAGQSIQQRADEIRRAVERMSAKLASGAARVVIGPKGSIAFSGISDEERDGVTDACAYRRLMVSGSALAKAAISRAELLSGTAVNRQTLATGMHSHDGGRTWHDHKG